MSTDQQQRTEHPSLGTHDGTCAGDHDQSYRFGWRATANPPYPFSTRQYSRLLVLRGRVQDGLVREDRASRRPADR
jgi:hypothetical protein